MNFLRIILLPLSLIYYIIISIRNYLYDFNIIKCESFDTPIISVGNITTGGTGKTPFVIYLTDFLLTKKKRVGVISRGYKSQSNKLVIAYDGNSITSDVYSTGDELSMIVNRFAGNNLFYAIAYSDRVKAINEMIIRFSPDVIILDDAFQNRRIEKSVDIVVKDKECNSFLNNLLLPAGNLRETNTSLKRADIIFNNYKFSNPDSSLTNNIRYKSSGFYNFNGAETEIPADKKVVLISGIGNNASFLNFANIFNLSVNKVYELSDHYNYSSKDIDEFKKNYKNDMVFLTTEKDFTKLKEFKDFVRNYPIYYLRIDVILDNDTLEKLLIKNNII